MRLQVFVAVIATLIASSAIASSARAQQAGLRHPAPAGSAALAPPPPARDSVGMATIEVTETYPGLLQHATVTPATAVGAALRKVKHGRLASASIEERGRRLVYVIRVDESKAGRSRELLVDANSGRVLSNRKLPRSH